MSHPGWAVAILFGIVVAVAVIVVLIWASSRGVFMFIDNVVRDSVEIAKPWREYAKEGHSLFVWRLLVGIATFATFGLAVTFFFSRGAALYDAGASPALPIGFIVSLGFLVLGLVLIWGFIVLFLKDFVAALMYRNRISCNQAWKLFLDVFRKYPFHFVGYGIIVFLFMIAFAVAVVFAGLATCCIGFIFLVIPYVSTVVTLPAWFTYRAFSLEFLAQFGPEYDVFKRQGAGMLAGKVVPARVAVQVQDVQLPSGGNLFPEDKGIPKMVAGIQEEDEQVTPDAGGHMQQRHGLGLERAAHGDLRPETVNRPRYNFLRGAGFEFFG
jgi:hypothetical protein